MHKDVFANMHPHTFHGNNENSKHTHTHTKKLSFQGTQIISSALHTFSAHHVQHLKMPLKGE